MGRPALYPATDSCFVQKLRYTGKEALSDAAVRTYSLSALRRLSLHATYAKVKGLPTGGRFA